MNSRMVVAIVVLGVLGMGGCAKPKPGELAEHQKQNTKYRAIHLETMLRPGPKLVTKNFEKMQVRFKDEWGFKRKYNVLIGPNPNEDEAIVAYKNPVVGYVGWIYASGECPYVETELVEATAHGTDVTIIVQIDGSIHRVYLLNVADREGADVRVPPLTGSWFPWEASDHSSRGGYSYVEVQGVTRTGPFGVNGALTPFVNYVVEQATLAEVPP